MTHCRDEQHNLHTAFFGKTQEMERNTEQNWTVTKQGIEPLVKRNRVRVNDSTYDRGFLQEETSPRSTSEHNLHSANATFQIRALPEDQNLNVEGRLTTKAFYADSVGVLGATVMTRVSVRPSMFESSWKSRGMVPAVACHFTGVWCKQSVEKCPLHPCNFRQRRPPNQTSRDRPFNGQGDAYPSRSCLQWTRQTGSRRDIVATL